MELPDVFHSIRRTIVAFGSRATPVAEGQPPFPHLIGTGFVVDARGIVATNRHVAEALRALPSNPVSGESAAFALVFGEVQSSRDGHTLGMAAVNIRGYDLPTAFWFRGPYYGAPTPDLAFVQLNVQDLPAVTLASEPNTLRIGMSVATAGFALGTQALVVYGGINQVTPILRRGIVASLYPFPCPTPHGFTIDIMTLGGESGSPIFLTSSPVVVGLLHAGFDNTNITIGLPAAFIAKGLAESLAVAPLDLSGVPSFDDIRDANQDGTAFTWQAV